MSGTARYYHALEVVADGLLYPTPGSSVVVPRAWTTNGTRPPLVLPFLIPKRTAEAPYPEAVEIFNISMAPDFTRLEVHVRDDGDSIYVSEIVDATVSDSDKTAAGTAEHTNTLHVEWNAPYISGCPDRPVNTTLATASGLDSDNRALILTDPGTTVGRLFSLQAVTFGTARDVRGYIVAIE